MPAQLDPDIAEKLAALLKGFRAYTRARSPEERARLEAEMFALFDSFGTTNTASIVLVRDAFEEMRLLRTSGIIRERTVEDDARVFADSRIREFEVISTNPRLSGPARNMLRIPFIEATKRAGQINQEQADASFDRLLESVRAAPSAEIEGNGRLRTSIAVIRAFYENFCNIPPFCSGKSK